MYKWKVSRGRSGAYWKVLWSIKSFSRVIITRHWFKPISPDDSSSSNFWRLHEASSICSIDDPNALRVGRRQLDAQKNAPRRLSSLICLTRLLIRGSYLYQQYHLNFIISISRIDTSVEYGSGKTFSRGNRRIELKFKSKLKKFSKDFNQKKKRPIYSNIFSITSVYNIKIKYFRMHRQLTMHASIVRTWSVSKDWIVSFFQRNRDSRDNSVMDIYISNFANAILCVVLYTFRDN